MSGSPTISSINVADSDGRSVLAPAGNKSTARKLTTKLLSKKSSAPEEDVAEQEKCTTAADANPSSSPPSSSPYLQHSTSLPSLLRSRKGQIMRLTNSSMNASCSSDASTESFHSRASTGRINPAVTSVGNRKKLMPRLDVSNAGLDSSQPKRTCAWVTANTDPRYAAFHDEEWGVPVHDDKKLFELLVLSGTLGELTWPAILSKRHMFREVFLDFDPTAVSKLSKKKLIALGHTASSLLPELKLLAIIENAKQFSKVIDEFGSFDNYIWSFVNHKPIISKFRYPRQIPVKTPKADVISKDLVRRGFRSVGQTVIYSFMQTAGLTNDHLISCFRFQECIAVIEAKDGNTLNRNSEDNKPDDAMVHSGICGAIDELSFSSE